jgi:hypothetical protein
LNESDIQQQTLQLTTAYYCINYSSKKFYSAGPMKP